MTIIDHNAGIYIEMIEMFDSATTKLVGRGLCLNAWPLAERAPHMH